MASPEDNAPPELVIDKVAESLTDEGHDVYHGREFITIREDGQLAPNSTVVEQYLEDTKAMMLAYNEDSNEIILVPLEQRFDRADVYGYKLGGTITGRTFVKEYRIEHDETVRYHPEWDNDIGGDQVDGGFRVDLDQDSEVVNTDASEADSTTDESEAAD